MTGALKSSLKEFCGSTTAHGFAYLVSSRNRAERIFWVLVMVVFLTWSVILALEMSIEWSANPVINVIKSIRYNPAHVPAPAIAICPHQYLDDLHLLSIRLNEIRFRCRETEEVRYAQMDLCNATHIQRLRDEMSPFYHFLEALKQMVNSAAEKVVGEVDWGRQRTRMFLRPDGKVKVVYDSLVHLSPTADEQPVDADHITYRYFPVLLHAFQQLLPDAGDVNSPFFDFPKLELEGANMVTQAHFSFKIPTDKDTKSVVDSEFFSVPTYNKAMPSEDIRNALEQIDQDFLQVGVKRVEDYDIYAINNPAIPEGIQVHYPLWRGILKKYYLINKLTSVGLGSLIRHYLPSMVFQEKSLAALLPLQTAVNASHENIVSNIFTAASPFFSPNHLKWLLIMDQKGPSRAYCKDLISFSNRTSSLFTAEIIEEIFGALKFAIVSHPAPTELDRSNRPDEYVYYEENIPSSERDPATYSVGHHFDPVGADAAARFFAIDDLLNTIGEQRTFQFRPHQLGRQLDSLDMIPYCSENANCRDYMRQQTTAHGLCSVWNGRLNTEDMTENHLLPFLKRTFHLPEDTDNLIQITDIQTMTFLLDIHNNGIKKALTEPGRISIAIGERNMLPYNVEAYLAQPGITATVTASPYVQTADEDIRSYHPNVRSCSFSDENTNAASFFKNYTRFGCAYDCAFQVAYAAMEPPCIPWDVPYEFQMGQTWLCHGGEAALFKERMLKSYAQCEAGCREACSSVQYKLSLESSLTNPELACRNGDFFAAIQNEEAETEFSVSHSVRRGYLLGSLTTEMFCHEKMQNDLIIFRAKFRSGQIIQSNVQRAARTLDHIGLFGGMLGLFVGCSLMFVPEVADLILTSLTTALQVALPDKDVACRAYIVRIIMLYFESTTLHGMAYISSTRNILGKLAWTALAIAGVATGVELSRLTYQGFGEQPVTKGLYHERIAIDRTPYPAITICPKQYNDRWNLARAILNMLPFRDEESGVINPEIYETFGGFFELLLSHAWVSREILDEQGFVNTTATYRLLESIVFNHEAEKLFAYKAREIFFEAFQSMEVVRHGNGSETFYEIDLGRVTAWSGVAVAGHILHWGGTNATQDAGDVAECSSHTAEGKYYIFHCYHSVTCDVPMVSRYVRFTSSGHVGSEAHVMFSPRPNCDVMQNCTCVHGKPPLVYPELRHCESVLQPSQECGDDLRRLWQIHIWERFRMTKLGSMISHFAETAMAGTFHPDGQGSGENALILTQNRQEIHMYKGLADMLDALFKTSAKLPLIDVPVLLDKSSHFVDVISPTQREFAARKIYYAHYELWKAKNIPEDQTYSFQKDADWFLGIGSKLGFSPFINAMHLRDKLAIHISEGSTDVPDIYNPWHADHQLDLAPEVGLDVIEDTYTTMFFSYELVSFLSDIMRIMRFSQVQGNLYMERARIRDVLKDNWNITVQRGLDDFSHVQLKSGKVQTLEEFDYIPADTVDSSYWIDHTWNRLEMVALCRFGELYTDSSACRSSFHHIITDQGICSAFNTLSAQSQYKRSVYLDMFTEIYNSAEVDSPALVPGYGQRTSLNLVLDIHQTDVFGSQSGHFEIAINNAPDSFSTVDGFFAFTGQRTDVSIETMVIKATDSVKRDVSIADRACRFEDEVANHYSPFFDYTQKRCVYECQLKAARLNVSCIPWDNFRFNNELRYPICTRDEVIKFHSTVTQAVPTCLTSCLENCEDITYEYFANRMKVNPDIVCSDHDTLLLAQLGISERHDLFYWSYWRRSQWVSDTLGHILPTDAWSRCIEKVEQDYAFVNFLLPKARASLLELTKTYAYESQLSIIGGTLCLWTGFSIISAIELFYWFFIALTNKLYQTWGWQAMSA